MIDPFRTTNQAATSRDSSFTRIMQQFVRCNINERESTDPATNHAEVYSQYITYRISQLNARLTAQATRLLKTNGGLSMVRWRILALLDAHAAITSSELVKAIAMDAGLFSRNLKALINEGLVRAEKNSDDQRQQLLVLTTAGTALFKQAEPAMNQRREQLTFGIAEEDLDTFYRVLQTLEQRTLDTTPENT